jgi:hypothetical protein
LGCITRRGIAYVVMNGVRWVSVRTRDRGVPNRRRDAFCVGARLPDGRRDHQCKGLPNVQRLVQWENRIRVLCVRLEQRIGRGHCATDTHRPREQRVTVFYRQYKPCVRASAAHKGRELHFGYHQMMDELTPPGQQTRIFSPQ